MWTHRKYIQQESQSTPKLLLGPELHFEVGSFLGTSNKKGPKWQSIHCEQNEISQHNEVVRSSPLASLTQPLVIRLLKYTARILRWEVLLTIEEWPQKPTSDKH